jgi:hypothetical protein
MGKSTAYSALLRDERARNRSSIPVRGERSLPQSFQTGSGVHPASDVVSTDVFSPGVKLPVLEADCPSPSVFEVKYGWYYTAPPYAIMACMGTVLLFPLHLRWQFSVCCTSGQKNGCGRYDTWQSMVAKRDRRPDA